MKDDIKKFEKFEKFLKEKIDSINSTSTNAMQKLRAHLVSILFDFNM